MSDPIDTNNCDELADMVRQQKRTILDLHGDVAALKLRVENRHSDVVDAQKAYNKFYLDSQKAIGEAQGAAVAAKKQWQDQTLTHLANVVKSAQFEEDEARRELEKKQQDLAQAEQRLQALQAAAARCVPKPKKSKLGGSVLIGVGVGLSIFGWTFLHGKTIDPKPATNSQPAVTTTIPHGGTDAAPVTPPPVATPKPGAPKKAHSADAPLGEDHPPMTESAPEQPKTTDKNESSLESDHSSSISTGSSDASGNDSSTDDSYSYEVSDSGGNTAVGDDSNDGSSPDRERDAEEQPRREPSR